jgi:hypothetical protein
MRPSDAAPQNSGPIRRTGTHKEGEKNGAKSGGAGLGGEGGVGAGLEVGNAYENEHHE